jgi:hypothetical protein
VSPPTAHTTSAEPCDEPYFITTQAEDRAEDVLSTKDGHLDKVYKVYKVTAKQAEIMVTSTLDFLRRTSTSRHARECDGCATSAVRSSKTMRLVSDACIRNIETA